MSEAIKKSLELLNRDTVAAVLPRLPEENFTLREGRRWAALADSGLLHGAKRKLAQQRAEQLCRRGEAKQALARASWQKQVDRIAWESASAQWAARESALNAEVAAREEAERAALIASLGLREKVLYIACAFVCMGLGLGVCGVLVYYGLLWLNK